MYTTGGSTVPAAIIGQILGGLIPKWGKFKVRGLIVQTAVMAAAVALLVPFSILYCDIPTMAGLNVDFQNT